MRELLGGEIPEERLATCGDCAMCGPRRGDGPSWDPRVKCCSYLPSTPSFQIGALLRDPDPTLAHGQAIIEKRIASGVEVTPLGFRQTPIYELLYRKKERAAFGRSLALRCPYFVEDGGLCSIWKYREAVCSTFFCLHARASVGRQFWDAMLELLSAVERALAKHCLLVLDPGEAALERAWGRQRTQVERRLSKEDLDGERDQDAARSVWGRWFGREREYFLECARVIETMSWPDVLAIGGTEVRGWSIITHSAYRRLVSTEIPDPLERVPVAFIPIDEDTVRVRALHLQQSFDAPREVTDVIAAFDGARTAEVRARLEEQHGLQLDDNFLRKLVDAGVLRPVDHGPVRHLGEHRDSLPDA